MSDVYLHTIVTYWLKQGWGKGYKHSSIKFLLNKELKPNTHGTKKEQMGYNIMRTDQEPKETQGLKQ